MSRCRHVLIVLPRSVHLMDVAGPAQVFTSATELGAGYSVSYVGDGEMTLSHQGLAVGGSAQWPRLEAHDLLLVPGWNRQRDRLGAALGGT